MNKYLNISIILFAMFATNVSASNADFIRACTGSLQRAQEYLAKSNNKIDLAGSYFSDTTYIDTYTLLNCAILNKNTELAIYLINNSDNLELPSKIVGLKPLHMASYIGDTRIVNELLKNNVEVDSVDNFGFTPLMYAVAYSNNNVVRELLKHNANVNHNPNDIVFKNPSTSALIIAVTTNNNNLVKLLLEHGADRDFNDKYLSKAIDYANSMRANDIINVLQNYYPNRSGVKTVKVTPQYTEESESLGQSSSVYESPAFKNKRRGNNKNSSIKDQAERAYQRSFERKID